MGDRELASSALAPHTIPAGIGLGVAFSALEAWRYPIFGFISSKALPLGPNEIAVIMLTLCCLFYIFIKKRIARSIWSIIAIALLSSATLTAYIFNPFNSSESFSFIAFFASFHMGFAILLFMLWLEELVCMPREKSYGVIVIGLFSTFAIQTSLIVVDRSIVWIACAILPVLSGTFLVINRQILPHGDELPDKRHTLHTDKRRAHLELKRLAELVLFFFIMLSCGLIFGLLNSAWRTSDTALGDANIIQLNTALGSLGAAIVLMLLNRPIKRGHIELSIVIFALAALLMEGMSPTLPMFFLIPMNVAQKLMFVLMPFLAQTFDDKPLRSLACCSMLLFYRLGLYAQSSLREFMSNTLSLDSKLTSSALVSIGCVAMIFFAVFELTRTKDDNAQQSIEQETLEYYRRLAFNYYLTQKLGLTQRESSIIDLLIQNKGIQDISKDLTISQSTVKTHLHNIYNKSHTSSRDDLEKLIEDEYELFFHPGSIAGDDHTKE